MGTLAPAVNGTQVTDAVLPNEKVSAQQVADSPHGQPTPPGSPQQPLPLLVDLRAREARGAVSLRPRPPLPGSAAALTTWLRYFSGILVGLTGHAHCWPRHGPDLKPEHPLSPRVSLALPVLQAPDTHQQYTGFPVDISLGKQPLPEIKSQKQKSNNSHSLHPPYLERCTLAVVGARP